MANDPENTLVVETTKGRVVIELRPDLAPGHVERIKTLARKGFYDGVAFRRDGRVLGEPRITYRSPGPDEAREDLRRSVLAAVNRCASLAFSPSFGQAIAGRPVAIRFVDDRRP